MVVILTPIVLMVVGIPGYLYSLPQRFTSIFGRESNPLDRYLLQIDVFFSMPTMPDVSAQRKT